MGGGQDLTPLEFFQKLKRICEKHSDDGYQFCGICPLYRRDDDKLGLYYLCSNIFCDDTPPCEFDEDLIRELIMKVYEIEED